MASCSSIGANMSARRTRPKERALSRGFARSFPRPAASIVLVVAAGDRGRQAAVVDELLQLFADLEERQALRRNGDRRARPRVASRVGLVGTHGKAPEAADLDAFTPLKSFRHGLEDAVDDELGTRLRELAARGHGIDEFAL